MDLFTTTDVNGDLIQVDMNGNILKNSYNLKVTTQLRLKWGHITSFWKFN